MQREGVYIPSLEKDSCGIGFVARLDQKSSHQVVQNGIELLSNMEHRGAVGAEANTGDGAGILTDLPKNYFRKKIISADWDEIKPDELFAVGMVMMPPQEVEQVKKLYQHSIEDCFQIFIGWRKVPVRDDMIGAGAKQSQPEMWQVFVKAIEGLNEEQFERKLFVIRKYMDQLVRKSNIQGKKLFYTVSLSCKKIIYKGQLITSQLQHYFPDLNSPDFEAYLAMVHSRFSTNTFPSWSLGQPFRCIAHNGEINTIRGNINWMRAREIMIDSEYFDRKDMEKIFPILDEDGSDSSVVDNVVELLMLCGRSLPHVMMMLIPEAWMNDPFMSEERKAFYEYHATMLEPWDGPAAVAFTDGDFIGATLDRNGLRPARYYVTEDNLLVLSSEQGALPVDESKVIEKGRLCAGKMFWANLKEGRIITDQELKDEICKEYPYRTWIESSKRTLACLPQGDKPEKYDQEQIVDLQRAFGYTQEDFKFIIKPMAQLKQESIGAMGNDSPLAVLSDNAVLLFNYFKQLFAQVTNPPIDPIREKCVMSLQTTLGPQGNLLALDEQEDRRFIVLDRPILTNEEISRLKGCQEKHFHAVVLPTVVHLASFKESLDWLCRAAIRAVRREAKIIILSDRGVDKENYALPALLAVSAVHHALIDSGLRSQCTVIIETAEAREVHHFATLLGYGVAAVNPYLALDSIEDAVERKLWNFNGTEDKKELHQNYIEAISKGLKKVISRMGISTIQSYIGAQIFEIIGLNEDFVNQYFKGTPSRIGGIGLEEIEEETKFRHRVAYQHQWSHDQLEDGGEYAWRQRGQRHLFSPIVVHLLQEAARNNDKKAYQRYAQEINEASKAPITLRNLLQVKQEEDQIPLEQVEPVESILKRFATGAMSLGSISREAHETLAIAMNRIGGKSNTGEGGEDPERFNPKENGDSACSAIKQVASGRFGVTSEYLTNAKEIQIKMAQGAKPGEGGQLPGKKVDEYIAWLRHSTPGVGLISPPPHHDIYSIEDLAQLIYDLKNANEQARINVKLVSEVGVGMVAAGVAKAHGDVVLISGGDGGTGASPLTSIKHAGLPWELGLAEVHQTLVKNGLRDRIIVQTDGQLRTGLDLAVATLLGAEEWGLATSALVSVGCIMMRKCHLNTCPVGIATQDKELRAMFKGRPEDVVNYLTFMAEELREWMAKLGFRTINEMVGRVDKLEPRETDHWKAKHLQLENLLYSMANSGVYCSTSQDHGLESVLDRKLIEKSLPALEDKTPVEIAIEVTNQNRTLGTMLSNRISQQYGREGLPDRTIQIDVKGSCGQSFGAFITKGIAFDIEGEANDYFCKGMCGAEVSIRPHREAKFVAEQNVIIGNVAFYGATSGKAFIRGLAGERFCVRNSGATVVVEGVGNHGCEYMTGGRVIILKSIGINFAAGMSGGIAYIYDPDCINIKWINQEMVAIERLEEDEFEDIEELIKEHYKKTGSSVAEDILSNWKVNQKSFIRVIPHEYKAVLARKKHEGSVSK